MSHKYPPVHYHQYLKLDQVLGAQFPKSAEYGQPAHDETLFIIVHQVYELWFKQLIHEARAVITALQQEQIPESQMGQVVHRSERMAEIFKLLIDQIAVLETMTPLDFLDFRDMLFPASGFQSFQFRQLEALLGLKESQRLRFNSQPYTAALSSEQSRAMQEIEKQGSLLEAVERWLERTPFLQLADFDFWSTYRGAVNDMLQRDRQFIQSSPALGDADRERNLKIIQGIADSFSSLFDESAFAQARQQGVWRLSHRALHAALFIQVYREQPILQQPFRLITALINLDELMTNWRYRHALLAKRMLGTKIGTGGSSGADYLKASTEQHRIFKDFNQLTTFFIARSHLPNLPSHIEKQLGFQYSAK